MPIRLTCTAMPVHEYTKCPHQARWYMCFSDQHKSCIRFESQPVPPSTEITIQVLGGQPYNQCDCCCCCLCRRCCARSLQPGHPAGRASRSALVYSRSADGPFPRCPAAAHHNPDCSSAQDHEHLSCISIVSTVSKAVSAKGSLAGWVADIFHAMRHSLNPSCMQG